MSHADITKEAKFISLSIPSVITNNKTKMADGVAMLLDLTNCLGLIALLAPTEIAIASGGQSIAI
jgi:hypothetical protein